MKRYAGTPFWFFWRAGLHRRLRPDASGRQIERGPARRVDEENRPAKCQNRCALPKILKLEQHVSNIRPGVIIGETPAPVPAEAPSRLLNRQQHVVAKGETLTSIAKMHKVSVEELQKFNHIENDRKLQIGQTIMIPSPHRPLPGAQRIARATSRSELNDCARSRLYAGNRRGICDRRS